MDAAKQPWHIAAGLTIMMSFATAIGTFASSYLLVPVKIREEAAKVAVDRKAKGEQLHCEKLQQAASLAAEVEFVADKGFARTIPDAQLSSDQLALEKRAAVLLPFISESDAATLNKITLHHHVVTELRTSKVPVEMRIPPAQGGFDANDELNQIRENTGKLAVAYRAGCTENG